LRSATQYRNSELTECAVSTFTNLKLHDVHYSLRAFLIYAFNKNYRFISSKYKLCLKIINARKSRSETQMITLRFYVVEKLTTKTGVLWNGTPTSFILICEATRCHTPQYSNLRRHRLGKSESFMSLTIRHEN
jgi:hypothetical protein